MKAWSRSVAAAVLMAVAPAVLAQAPAAGAVQSKLDARKVVRGADGQESFSPAESVRPGDVIEYVATYRNAGKAPVRSLEATLPIPENTELIEGTARPANARASSDGRAFAVPPLKRRVARNGVDVEESVPLRDYRALRWSAGELKAEQTVSFSARVKVTDDKVPGEPGNRGGGK